MSGLLTSEPAVFEQGKAIPAAGITLLFWLSYDNRGAPSVDGGAFPFLRKAHQAEAAKGLVRTDVIFIRGALFFTLRAGKK